MKNIPSYLASYCIKYVLWKKIKIKEFAEKKKNETFFLTQVEGISKTNKLKWNEHVILINMPHALLLKQRMSWNKVIGRYNIVFLNKVCIWILHCMKDHKEKKQESDMAYRL